MTGVLKGGTEDLGQKDAYGYCELPLICENQIFLNLAWQELTQ